MDSSCSASGLGGELVDALGLEDFPAAGEGQRHVDIGTRGVSLGLRKGVDDQGDDKGHAQNDEDDCTAGHGLVSFSTPCRASGGRLRLYSILSTTVPPKRQL